MSTVPVAIRRIKGCFLASGAAVEDHEGRSDIGSAVLQLQRSPSRNVLRCSTDATPTWLQARIGDAFDRMLGWFFGF